MRFHLLAPWFLLLVAIVPAARAGEVDELAPLPPLEEDLAPLPPIKPAPPTDLSAWLGVTEFLGFFECTRVNRMDRPNPPNVEQGWESSVATVKFVLTKLPGGDQWVVKKATASGSRQSTRSNDSTWHHGRTTETGTFSAQPVNDLSLKIDRKTGAWTFRAGGQLLQPYTVQHTMVSRNAENGNNGVTWLTETRESEVSVETYAHGSIRGTVATDKPDVLSGNWDFMQASASDQTADDFHARVHLVPLAEEVDLVVELHGLGAKGGEIPMAEWRPLGTVDRKPGSALKAIARLKTPEGKPSKVGVKKFIFRLKDTSREPGVCLNYPLHASPKAGGLATADLRFAAGDGETDAEQQEKAVQPQKDAEDYQFAETKIEALDWGAWADLIVQAELADGRIVTGHLDGDPSAIVMPLPEREAGSRIATFWKKKHEVTGADLDDDEKIEGQKDNGDGYTLYEEYRGWIEKGQHLEGDPKEKDFFVLNLIGADAEPGIELFADVSRLVVHSKLRPEEMSEKTRLMNGNHRAGAHNKDQHGVWVKTFASSSSLGDNGAITTLNEKGVAGRPGITKGIGVLARDNTESAFNKPFNLAAADAIFAFDRAIAHELLHSVGVEHHGSGDYRMIVGYASTRNPLNKLGRPYYGTEVDKPIDLRTEAGEDVAQRDLPEYEKFRKFTDMMMLERFLKEGAEYIAKNGANYNRHFSTPEKYADFQIELLIVFCFMHLDGNVGVEHGVHSGAEACLTRYYFAKYYESKLPPAIGKKRYYLIEPGTEHIGMEICHDGKGTGVNAAGHSPQSRYGDTAGDAGNCFEQICPNDAIPPRKVK